MEQGLPVKGLEQVGGWEGWEGIGLGQAQAETVFVLAVEQGLLIKWAFLAMN